MCFLSPYEHLETMFTKVYIQWQQINQLANELQTTVSPLPLEGQNPLHWQKYNITPVYRFNNDTKSKQTISFIILNKYETVSLAR